VKTLFRNLWDDDRGTITLEWLLFATILIFGLIVGLATLRAAITTELAETGNAILTISQGFSVSGLSTSGGGFDGFATFDFPGISDPPVSTPPPFGPFPIDVFIN
jgi:hypothetical protein